MTPQPPTRQVELGNLADRDKSWIDPCNVTLPSTLCKTHAAPRFIAFCALLISLLGGTSQAALFLDVTSVTPGGPGTGAFTGTLGGIGVTGSISASGGAPSFFFSGAGGGIGDSTIDNSSPQYSYGTVYSPTAALTDRIGWTSLGTKTETVVISLSSAVVNPVFHVANLDWAQFSFAATPGLTSLTYLNGNFDGTDGLDATPGALGFGFVQDFNPSTSDGTPPAGSPPTTGARSAYGSVQLNGTISTIVIGMGTNGPFSDTGSFTISVPEPGSLILGIATLGVAVFTRRRGRETPGQALRVRH